MADILSPVKEECVRHGHELNVSECKGPESCRTVGWLDMGMSLIWWSTTPVRFGLHKAAQIHPKTGAYIQAKLDPLVDKMQETFPAMTDEKSNQAVSQLQIEMMRQSRHKLRSVIRSGAGRRVLQGLDKMITISEPALDYIEARQDEQKSSSSDSAADQTSDKDRRESRDSDSAVNMDESAGECDKATMTSSSTKSSSTNTDEKKRETWLWVIMANPIHLWIDGLKLVRRYLYRIGRLRRCKSTRTPAKDIAKRPMISPRKRQQVGSSFTSMIKFALSPIAIKPAKAKLDDVKGVKAKELRVPLKRKYNKVTPYSTGDDSDNDTGRIVDDYFQLQDYDSEEDSDYEWHSSDDYLTSDSEEYRTDSESEYMDLKSELEDVKKENENEFGVGEGNEQASEGGKKRSAKPKVAIQSSTSESEFVDLKSELEDVKKENKNEFGVGEGNEQASEGGKKHSAKPNSVIIQSSTSESEHMDLKSELEDVKKENENGFGVGEGNDQASEGGKKRNKNKRRSAKPNVVIQSSTPVAEPAPTQVPDSATTNSGQN